MKVSRHEKAIREGLARLDKNLEDQHKISDQSNQKIWCLIEQRRLLSQILNTADLMGSKPEKEEAK